MAIERITLDDLTYDSTQSPLDLVDIPNGVTLYEHEYPTPPLAPSFTDGQGMDGEVLTENRYSNREINLKLRVIEPTDAAGTNLVTNPSFETNTTSWANNTSFLTGTGGTFTRVADTDGMGDFAAERTTNGADSAPGIGYATLSLTASTVYTVTVRVKRTAGSRPITMKVGRNASPFTEYAVAVSQNPSSTAYTTYTAQITPSATDTYTLFIRADAGGVTTYRVDSAAVIAETAISSYFDGDTIGCAWTGTPHASTSTRPATGGDRLAMMLSDIQGKLAKINREGGTLRRITAAGDPITFDLLTASGPGTAFDFQYLQNRNATFDVTFTAKPFGRGADVTLSDHLETTSPALVFTEAGIKGNVPALGKLVITEAQGVDQWWLVWGIQSRYYSSNLTQTGSLFIEAETLTPLSTSATATGATGASGTVPNVMRNTNLTSSYQAILSTKINLGGGLSLVHVGTYRVFARLYRPTTNTGAVKVALEWAQADFGNYTRNDAVSYAADEREGAFTIADLGLVHLSKVAQGSQHWEGRIIANSTVYGDELDVDWLMLVPTDEGYGEVTASSQLPTLTTYTAQDEFDQAAGALTGKTLPTGGTWTNVASDDGDDFNTIGGGIMTRTATSDVDLNTGRYVSAGTTAYAAITVRSSSNSGYGGHSDVARVGVFARLVDVNNWIMAVRALLPTNSPSNLRPGLAVYKRVSGTVTRLGYALDGLASLSQWATPELSVTADGKWTAKLYDDVGDGSGATLVDINGYDADLVTGGTLDDGKIGVYDAYTSGTAATRFFNNFAASAPPTHDAALYASQSLQVRSDRVIREDSSGTYWGAVSDYQGSYLTVPVAGKEQRQTRVIVKASRNTLDSIDSGTDDITATLTYTPRYLQLPDAS